MTLRVSAWIALVLVTSAVVGCHTANVAARAPASEPLIWDVRAKIFVSREVVVRAVLHARFRLLGEVHDNPAHHALRADLLRTIAAANKHPAVVFEQFDAGYEQALRRAQEKPIDAEALADAGALDRSGWQWPLHKGLIEAALAGALPVHAGNADRAALEPVTRRGDLGSVPIEWRTVLDRAPWDADKELTLTRVIEAAHCGKLPSRFVPQLALAQRVRDAALAAALLEYATLDGAILIAGNGHARADTGVPLYLQSANVVTIGWVEVDALDRRETTGRAAEVANPGFDFLWLTGGVDRADPCEAFRAPT
ncbi:MAG: ChaN family lipoprotein [Pseudomonadota bacterium]|nr:ChaN family lipoprotein [Pseudomonadota bacterium]